MRGECVRFYEGKRGGVWRLRYRDANGELVNETLGKVADGWSEKKAKAALEERRTDVRREGLTRPASETFAEVAAEWLVEFPDKKKHQRTTRADYAAMLRNHLVPAFGTKRISAITSSDVDAYVVAKRKGRPSLGAQTLNQHLNRLHAIFEHARKKGLVKTNPVKDAERARVPRSRWTILSPVDVASVMTAFGSMVGDSEIEAERAWAMTAKAMVATMTFAWLRRGELLGLRWRDVELAHPNGPRLHVRQTWVRGHESKPKTDEGTRPSLSPDHWRTSYSGISSGPATRIRMILCSVTRPRARPSAAATSRRSSPKHFGVPGSSARCASTTTGDTPASRTRRRQA